MLVYKSQDSNHKIKSNETINLNDVSDLLQLTTPTIINLEHYNLVCYDVDDEYSRSIILKLHNDNKLNKYVYSIKKNGSAHFYFIDPNKEYEDFNKKSYLNYYGLQFEILTKESVFSHPDYEYINFDKLFNINPLNFPDVRNFDWLFNLVATTNHQFCDGYLNLNIKKDGGYFNYLEDLKSMQEKDGRGRKLFALGSVVVRNLNNNHFHQQHLNMSNVIKYLSFINDYMMHEPLTLSDGENAITSIVERIFNNNQSLKKSSINNLKDLLMIADDLDENELKKHERFLIKKTIKHPNKSQSDVFVDNFNLYELSQYLINLAKIKKDEKDDLYGIFENTYLNLTKPFMLYNETTKKNAMVDKILYQCIAKLYIYYGISTKFNTQSYNEIIKHLNLGSKLFNENDISSMNIHLYNGVLEYDKQNNDYTFKPYENYQKPLFHIINFTNIKWLENNEDFDEKKYLLSQQKIENYLSSLHQDVQGLWILIANTFLYNNYLRKAFILSGSGKNGKSTFISFLNKLNMNYYSSINIDQITSQFMGHHLRYKTMNTNPELQKEIKGDDTLLKSLIGNDEVNMDVKNDKNGVRFTNKATLIFATNNELVFSNYTRALLDRLVFIKFQSTFNNTINDNLLNELLSNEYDYFYIIKKSIEIIKQLVSNQWKFSIVDNEIEQKNFKINNSTVIRYFGWLNFLNDDLEVVFDNLKNNVGIHKWIELKDENTIHLKVDTMYLHYKEKCENNGFLALGYINFFKHLKDIMLLETFTQITTNYVVIRKGGK